MKRRTNPIARALQKRSGSGAGAHKTKNKYQRTVKHKDRFYSHTDCVDAY